MVVFGQEQMIRTKKLMHNALIDELEKAGFKSRHGESTYISIYTKGSEQVWYNARTGSPGYQAIKIVSPTPPERPGAPARKRPDFGNSKLGQLQSAVIKDIIDSGLSEWTAEAWRKSAESRGTFESISN